MPESHDVNPGCAEKFVNIESRLKDLQNQTTTIQRKSDEDTNGKYISEIKMMFNNLSQEIARQSVENTKISDRAELKAEKFASLIADLRSDFLNLVNEGKNNKSILDNAVKNIDILKAQVSKTENKSKVDLSLAGKFLMGAAGVSITTVVVAFVAKFIFKV